MSKILPINNPNGCHGRISLELNDSVIWNIDEFIKFLIDHQNLVIDVEISEGACLDSAGVYKLMQKFSFLAVNIRTHNIIESAPVPYKLELHPAAWQYFDVPADINYFPYHVWNGNKIFGALYNRPTWPRIGLASHLYAYHKDQTVLNFRANPHDVDQREFFELEKLFCVDPKSVGNYFAGLEKDLPIQLEEQDGYTVGSSTKDHTDQLAQYYPDFLIDIVVETFVRGRSFYPTEKTTRAMLMKKPFIIMGSKCFLLHLRQMGFKTFYEFWDETYDGHRPETQYLQILKVIDTIANKSKEELFEMYNQMQSILEHNYNLLIEKKFVKKVEYVE